MSQTTNNDNDLHSINPEDTYHSDNINSQLDETTNINPQDNTSTKENHPSLISSEDTNPMDTQTSPIQHFSSDTETDARAEKKIDVADTSAGAGPEQYSSNPIEDENDINEKNSFDSTSTEEKKGTIDQTKQMDERISDTQPSPLSEHSISKSVLNEEKDYQKNNFASLQGEDGEHPSQIIDHQMDQSDIQTIHSHSNEYLLSSPHYFPTDEAHDGDADHSHYHSNMEDPEEESKKKIFDEPVIQDEEDDEKSDHCQRCASLKLNDHPINDRGSDNTTLRNCLDLCFHDDKKEKIKKPNEIENDMPQPPNSVSEQMLDRIQGSIIGMALGDALGAHVEFRPHKYLLANPVKDLEGGGTWGLQKGQFTDDTSMALCLANSLVISRDFVPYDQLVRYKWWYRHGYMSSTGQCFDIGHATRQSIIEFERRQMKFLTNENIENEKADYVSDDTILKKFDENCSEDGVAGNGALMRLAPVPLFFSRYPSEAVEFSGRSGRMTHGDDKAYDACRYYGALIVAALHGHTKKELLSKKFYSNHKSWFAGKELHPDIKLIANGSYKKKQNYEGGIRGKGYIVSALEAALWAFWSDGESFKRGALDAVNLGDDTDTTAAIYGQLAGAYYGYQHLPKEWLQHVYAHLFLKKLSQWIAYEGQRWRKTEKTSL